MKVKLTHRNKIYLFNNPKDFDSNVENIFLNKTK